MCVLSVLALRSARVAISNHRLVAFQHDQVTFRYKDYAQGNKKRLMTLSSQEFLRRFLLHLLPRGFVRIRFYGFLAHRRRANFLPLSTTAATSSQAAPIPINRPS